LATYFEVLSGFLILYSFAYEFGLSNELTMALWELPGLGEDMGVFWWFHHQNTPIYPLYHGDSQRPLTIFLDGGYDLW
jgi:hypothetical protein